MKLFFTLLAAVILHTFVSAQVNNKDSLAVVKLYKTNGGTAWVNKDNWLTKLPLKTWYGITYDSASKRVFEIKLTGNNLTGQLPDSLKIMDSLKVFNVSGNKLNGTIPGGLLVCPNLRTLNLSNNQFTGGFPLQDFKLLLLTSLDLSYNQLTDSLPTSLTQLPALKYLSLAYNKFNFNGMEKVAKAYPSAIMSPQPALSLVRDKQVLSVKAGGKRENNTYYWYKNGILDTRKAGDSTYIITDSATYYVRVENSKVTPLKLQSGLITLHADWLLLATDTSSKDKTSWDTYALGYTNNGHNTGVYFGGNYSFVGFYNRLSNTWANTGTTDFGGQSVTYLLPYDESFAVGSPIYRYCQNDTFSTFYPSVKTLTGWATVTGADRDPTTAPWHIATNGTDLYGMGNNFYIHSGKDSTNVLFAKWNGSKWVPFDESAIGDMVKPYGGIYDFNEGWIKATHAGLFFAIPIYTNTLKKQAQIFVFRYDGKNWSMIGKPFKDYSENFPQSRAVNLLPAFVTAMTVGQVGSTDIAIAGTFMNEQGKYYIAKYKPASDTWEQYGEWDGLGGKFFPNEVITSLTRNSRGDIFASGYFTDAAGNPYVAKIDILGKAKKLGNNVLKADHIYSLVHGNQYDDDVFASGPFQDVNNKTNYLAHFAAANCTAVNVKASALVIKPGTPVTFTATVTNGGDNPQLIWRKNNYILIGQSGAVYKDSTLRNGDTVTCIVIGNAECSTAPAEAGTVVTVSNPLPLTFLSFTGVMQKGTAQLHWQTTNEVNTSYFNVQRSIDGETFTAVGKVTATGQNSYYSYADVLPVFGVQPATVYYHLQQVDKDGRFTTSNTIALKPGERSGYILWPNPVHNVLHIQLANSLTKNIITIYSLDGRKMRQTTSNASNIVTIDISSLATGIYIIEIINGKYVFKQKFVKE